MSQPGLLEALSSSPSRVAGTSHTLPQLAALRWLLFLTPVFLVGEPVSETVCDIPTAAQPGGGRAGTSRHDAETSLI